MPQNRLAHTFASVSLALLGTTMACGQFGYSDRVLQRVPSPDRQLVAVCQEIPAFDGPGYEVRLEEPDGRVRRRLYQGLDDDQCDEIVWSADGQSLAVLTRHIARVRVVNVSKALAVPDRVVRRESIAETSFSSATAVHRGWDLRFAAPHTASIALCAYEWEEYARTGKVVCKGPERRASIMAPPGRNTVTSP